MGNWCTRVQSETDFDELIDGDMEPTLNKELETLSFLGRPESFLTRPRTGRLDQSLNMEADLPWMSDPSMKAGVAGVGDAIILRKCPKIVVYDCLAKGQAFIDNVKESNIGWVNQLRLLEAFYWIMDTKFQNYEEFMELDTKDALLLKAYLKMFVNYQLDKHNGRTSQLVGKKKRCFGW